MKKNQKTENLWKKIKGPEITNLFTFIFAPIYQIHKLLKSIE